MRLCDTCGGRVKLKVFACALHTACTPENQLEGLHCCKICPDNRPIQAPQPASPRLQLAPWNAHGGIAPSKLVARFDEKNLAPEIAGLRFNSSIIDYEDGYLFSFRTGWAGSMICLVRLDKAFQPVGDAWQLDLTRSEAGFGREDARLFRFNGRIHVAYVGVVRPRGKIKTNMLYARLGNDLRVEANFFLRIPNRSEWVKNISFFDFNGTLFAIYSIAPHRILRVEGEQASWAYETPTPAPWRSGEMRGGASPVLVGDEWYHWFHARREANRHRIYQMGCYTFTNKPPFHITRITPTPLMEADPKTKPEGQYCSCIFPCGSVLIPESS